ncbi:MepB family protein [Brumimicrobium mesophilum]|uniref:MepB family protein n=1 Tax=Brumimicrobium mesophilum TaxID=392717 RepID=UPI000D143AE1|nr:MepB family protein [Brumimicrobium mesophilum]
MDIPEIELLDAKLFIPQGKKISNIVSESESKEYLAHTFQLDGQKVIFRKAKITPTKTGQFVTIWKRNNEGITSPYNIVDDFEFFIILVQKEESFGVFIFPKAVLHQKKIISDERKDGKRGIRVYPLWDLPMSKQAIKTQEWQIKYFFELKIAN